jgi:hypothetical protein
MRVKSKRSRRRRQLARLHEENRKLQCVVDGFAPFVDLENERLRAWIRKCGLVCGSALDDRYDDWPPASGPVAASYIKGRGGLDAS